MLVITKAMSNIKSSDWVEKGNFYQKIIQFRVRKFAPLIFKFRLLKFSHLHMITSQNTFGICCNENNIKNLFIVCI